jgi:hypothetical protein
MALIPNDLLGSLGLGSALAGALSNMGSGAAGSLGQAAQGSAMAGLAPAQSSAMAPRPPMYRTFELSRHELYDRYRTETDILEELRRAGFDNRMPIERWENYERDSIQFIQEVPAEMVYREPQRAMTQQEMIRQEEFKWHNKLNKDWLPDPPEKQIEFIKEEEFSV